MTVVTIIFFHFHVPPPPLWGTPTDCISYRTTLYSRLFLVSHFTNRLLCCPLLPPSLQPQGRPHPQVPAQPIRGRYFQRRQVTLKEVQVPMALPQRGNRGHLTRSQSVWRWRVRWRGFCLDWPLTCSGLHCWALEASLSSPNLADY